MLDPQYIRDNLDAVKANCKNRNVTNADPDRVDPSSRLVLWIVGAWLVALVCTGIVCLVALPWIMAALHPAYILRQHGSAFDEARASLVRDIGTARLKVVELRKAARTSSEG